MNLKIDILCQSFLKNYVYWKEQIPIGEPIDLSIESELRMVMLAQLIGKNAALNNNNMSDPIPQKYSDVIRVSLPVRCFAQGKIYYTLPNIRWIDTYLYKRMVEDLLYKVMLNKQHGIDENKTILAFIDALKADHLVEFDRLKKAVYRLRKARNLPVFRIQNCPYTPNPYQFSVLDESA